MQTQRKRNESRKNQNHRAARPEYLAAIRYLDGSRDLFRVRNADDLADARALVLSELGDVRSLVLSLSGR